MDIGLVLQTDPPASHVIEQTRKAEDAGFSHVWTFESCVLWQDTFVIFPCMLAATSKVIVGPMVTNPVQRDWTVIASMFATLNDMFGDRTVCGIGRGDSALRVIGGSPISMKGFAESITTIKDLAEGREATINGTRVRIPWAGAGRLPMWGAGYGPKALQVIGQLADGFILQTADPVITHWVIETVRAPLGPLAAIRPLSPCASLPRLTSVTTWPTSATSCAGSAAWSATTSPTSSPATASTPRCLTSSPIT